MKDQIMGGDVYLCYVFAELGNFLADKKIKISTLEIRLRATKFIRTRDKLAELYALDHVVAAGECGLVWLGLQPGLFASRSTARLLCGSS